MTPRYTPKRTPKRTPANKHGTPAPDSTRAAILRMLRARPRTVPALAEALSISGTAVRKQLDRLLHEGLVVESGLRRGRGRPAATFGLAEAGEATFRRNREKVLRSVLAALHANPDEALRDAVLRDAGARLARTMLESEEGPGGPDPEDDPLDTALRLLRDLGGRESVRQSGGKAEIVGFTCPLAEYAREFQGACRFVAGFTEEVVGVPVEDLCPRSGEPVCVLSVASPGAGKSGAG
jgi:predicted ArsR family transcriptional regulator